MTGKMGRKLVRLLIAYFAGAITMLIVLSPGDLNLSAKIKALMDKNTRSELADFDQAAGKVQQATDKVCSYFKDSDSSDDQGIVDEYAFYTQDR